MDMNKVERGCCIEVRRKWGRCSMLECYVKGGKSIDLLYPIRANVILSRKSLPAARYLRLS
jgi:hypothetical protein